VFKLLGNHYNLLIIYLYDHAFAIMHIVYNLRMIIYDYLIIYLYNHARKKWFCWSISKFNL